MAKKKISAFETPVEAFSEAKRYLANAKETLSLSPIEYGIYKDKKYVKEASAMGYLSALAAIDGWLLSTNIKRDKLPTSIEEYEKAMKKIPHNGKLMSALVVVYQNLHILGYYKGGVGVDMIKEGFQKAKLIIETLSKGET
jgi:hypothetical protein